MRQSLRWWSLFYRSSLSCLGLTNPHWSVSSMSCFSCRVWVRCISRFRSRRFTTWWLRWATITVEVAWYSIEELQLDSEMSALMKSSSSPWCKYSSSQKTYSRSKINRQTIKNTRAKCSCFPCKSLRGAWVTTIRLCHFEKERRKHSSADSSQKSQLCGHRMYKTHRCLSVCWESLQRQYKVRIQWSSS